MLLTSRLVRTGTKALLDANGCTRPLRHQTRAALHPRGNRANDGCGRTDRYCIPGRRALLGRLRPSIRNVIIVHVIADLNTGGAEMMLKRLIEAHHGNSEFEHHVISLRGGGTIGPALQEMGVPVIALGMRGAISVPMAVKRLASALRELRPDVVQTWMYHGDFLGGLAARIARIRPVVWGVRVTEFTRQMGVSRSTALLRHVCAFLSREIPERIVYVAHSARRSHERIGYAPEKGIVIPNGYRVPANPPRTGLRRELGLSDDALIIGTAGR